MNYVNHSAFVYLKNKYENIAVVDVGVARGSFLVELEKVWEDMGKVYAIGMDPCDHGVADHYDRFIGACADNVEHPTIRDFYVNNMDEQSSSLCEVEVDNLSSDEFDRDKFYYSQGLLDNMISEPEVEVVNVYNLDTIIKEELPEGSVHFIKIDAEGRDLEIVKSLSDDTLERTKFICIECPNEIPRFKGESTKKECVDYLESKKFKVFNCVDYQQDPTNRSPMSDVVFINGEEL